MIVTIPANSSIRLIARVEKLSLGHDPYLSSEIESVEWNSTDRSDPTTAADDGTFVVDDVVFDTVVEQADDPDWTWDTGYNLDITIPGTAFPEGNKTYVLNVIVTPTGESPITISRTVQTDPLYPRS